MLSDPTKYASSIETASLWYCCDAPLACFKKQFILVLKEDKDSDDNEFWHVYVTPRMIRTNLYAVNIHRHFVRVD